MMRVVFILSIFILSLSSLTHSNQLPLKVEVNVSKEALKDLVAPSFFFAAFKIINVSSVDQKFSAWVCSRSASWISDSAEILIEPEPCDKNFIKEIKLRPTEEYTGDLRLQLKGDVNSKPSKFRLGFNPNGVDGELKLKDEGHLKDLIWSNEIIFNLDNQQQTHFNSMDKKQMLDLARSAAKAFCLKFNFFDKEIKLLDGEPLFVSHLERDWQDVISYRWLGGGRGDSYVQAEIDQKGNQVVVYGGYAHNEFGPWIFKTVFREEAIRLAQEAINNKNQKLDKHYLKSIVEQERDGRQFWFITYDLKEKLNPLVNIDGGEIFIYVDKNDGNTTMTFGE